MDRFSFIYIYIYIKFYDWCLGQLVRILINSMGHLPPAIGLGGQSYLLLVGGGRCPMELVEVLTSWPRYRGHTKNIYIITCKKSLILIRFLIGQLGGHTYQPNLFLID